MNLQKTIAPKDEFVKQLTSRRQALDALHARLWEVVPLVPTGQYKQPHAWRNTISGMLRASSAVYWGIEKR